MASSKEHAEIRAALERYSKEELVDLMEHLLRLYVLNEPVKVESALQKPDSIKELSGYSFAQVLSMLKTSLDLEELDAFRVTPITTFVSIGGVEFDMNGPAPTTVRQSDEDAASAPADEDDDSMTPAERMDLDSKPWRSAPARPAKAPVSRVETPSMAELFADDSNKDRGYIMFNEPPTAAEDEDDDQPPIAESAPGDDPEVPAAQNDFARAAATREDEPAPVPATPATPPALAEGDKQIDPSNRFASLDLD